jgi:dTDP-4-amino-4,6-dideoxygalactose transaminase
MILTDDEKLAEKARYLTTQAKDDPGRFIHDEIGYNFRLTNIQAALGVAQLEQLSEFLERKIQIYHQYVEAVKEIEGLRMAKVPDWAENNHWMNILLIDEFVYGKDRVTLISHLLDADIQTRPVWTLNHQQKPYRDCQNYRIERAEVLVYNSLCLPSSANLNDDNLNHVTTQLNG